MWCALPTVISTTHGGSYLGCKPCLWTDAHGPCSLLGQHQVRCLTPSQMAGRFPESAPPAELARQMQSWHSLGATSTQLGYEVRWILGDVQSDSWIELDPISQTAARISSLPQPQGWRHVNIVPLATTHTVPSCAWMFETKEKAGKFNRLKAAELRLTTAQQTELGQGRDITLANGESLAASSFRSAQSNLGVWWFQAIQPNKPRGSQH